MHPRRWTLRIFRPVQARQSGGAGVGLSLCRDSVALQEKHRHGLAINERVSIDCTLSFICLQSRREEGPIACALDVMDRVWGSAVTNSAADLTPQRSDNA